jgi:starvation-inducible DNA-binding protein
MFKTKNDLSETIRGKAIELLNARLADAIDLQTQTKQAHWNIKGPNFIALHELFDKVNEDVEDYVDEIAERVVQLGGVAEGTARMAAKRSSLSEYPANTVDGRSHVEALSSALAAFGKSARKGIDQANEFNDLDTADLFTEISRGVDKWLWFVEAHLQA